MRKKRDRVKERRRGGGVREADRERRGLTSQPCFKR